MVTVTWEKQGDYEQVVFDRVDDDGAGSSSSAWLVADGKVLSATQVVTGRDGAAQRGYDAMMEILGRVRVIEPFRLIVSGAGSGTAVVLYGPVSRPLSKVVTVDGDTELAVAIESALQLTVAVNRK